jgi:hypothetical protein
MIILLHILSFNPMPFCYFFFFFDTAESLCEQKILVYNNRVAKRYQG